MTSPVLAVAEHFNPTATKHASFALTLATSTTVFTKETRAMTTKQYEAEFIYQMSISHFKSMLKRGLITPEQYGRANANLLKKYKPLLGKLFSDSACNFEGLE